MNHRFKDLSGKQYGRLTVIKLSGMTKSRSSLWECLCACGNKTIVRIANLSNGHTKSCGCISIETVIARNTIHGNTANGKPSREYVVWASMKQRCLDPKAINYERYGGRGITVCERWRNSFVDFLNDMGKCPHGLTIDRKDNNGNYEPGNCRWATDFEQRTNRRDNRIVSFNGKTMSAIEWDIACGFTPGTVRYRLHKGWTPERAITQPLRKHKCRP